MPNKKKSYTEIDDIREDLNSLRTNVVELTKHLRADGAENIEHAKIAASGRYNAAKTAGLKQLVRAEKAVQKKPGQSMLMAFAAGLAISALLRK
jgi:ElaB/YqjD/DUF883 family membrane-anchored ribosome-binding protein